MTKERQKNISMDDFSAIPEPIDFTLRWLISGTFTYLTDSSSLDADPFNSDLFSVVSPEIEVYDTVVEFVLRQGAAPLL